MLHVDIVKTLREFTLALAAEFPAGTTVIFGPSGAGKSTLLRAIAGLVRPDGGSIRLDDRVLSDATTFVPAFKRNIGVLFQEYALFPHMNVEQNVAYGLRARNMPRDRRETLTTAMLERLEINALRAARVDELSGGQRQRVALARALIVEPGALLLDEPFSALDGGTRGRVRAELAGLLESLAIPTLLVSHDEDDRSAFGGRTLHLEHGTLAQA